MKNPKIDSVVVECYHFEISGSITSGFTITFYGNKANSKNNSQVRVKINLSTTIASYMIYALKKKLIKSFKSLQETFQEQLGEIL